MMGRPPETTGGVWLMENFFLERSFRNLFTIYHRFFYKEVKLLLENSIEEGFEVKQWTRQRRVPINPLAYDSF